ncbi:MAG: aspartate--tRNA ligase [Candidatus Portnoybacteria bacterium CG_4_10_14_0_2_um_filter_43_36]|uniref:Aspartate--tRNA(Asp/Asn) ligase n=4 Tax=Bacteria candidate phyla TaxID=1783234 RepID=A0A2M7YLM2_9BACT|nr:MAG: aspartate--tRNA ligase [Candidatus Berkelbacteria bacterium CG23_combo_of_CG06-09_8_20_14_all_41_73]PIZ27551.1 MAG: aspartate--tRNA ligase [Candidatus Berkelbacteria bacterium CG_4_10_14_0_8_um_filter_42_34]PIZ69865.1 MAG: aspartate--tRNA ligase [Candidatus Portnoybacteria bacterium CG_4_10_14_0_2_um_filter_43_36]PJA63888.1 MAG: aspartate--tRNA ligase [Candidatus Portnoybacteria bacterium CG_4_9_14_3_um_filter_43_11]
MRILSAKTIEKIGEEVKLSGWVHNRRDHGQLIFVDLRDRSGLVQLVFLPDNRMVYEEAGKLRSEWVIEVIGKVKKRPDKMVNDKIPTGGVEVEVRDLKILNPSATPPFEISDEAEVNEELRLKYRYLDLRRPKMRRNLVVRHKVIKLIRDFLDKQGFTEVETPVLTKSTPEGARDFIVPSRLHPGEFYALPQSPQQFKQILMVAGLERYFQIVRCFRDEDLRGERQPEFTQLDLEMSFVNQEMILDLIEKLYLKIIQELVSFNKTLSKKLTFKPFARMDYDEAIRKYHSDKPDLRKNKDDPNELAFVWILNWPLFEWNADEKRYDACHHIFTAPQEKDLPLLDKDPLKARSWQHDLVLNGHEVGGGSIRIHQRDIQEKIFKLIGLSEKQVNEKFGHLLRAFEYGAPPHGGIALGLDRLMMLLLNEKSIREVMAFPKTGDGRDLMMEAPGPVDAEQLKEVGINVIS